MNEQSIVHNFKTVLQADKSYDCNEYSIVQKNVPMNKFNLIIAPNHDENQEQEKEIMLQKRELIEKCLFIPGLL